MPHGNTDYSNTVFYKIYCNDATVSDIYVGHTTNFEKRKSAHKRTCIKANNPSHHLKVYKFIRANGGWDNWRMDMIGFHNCTDHSEARKIEQNYFETLHATLNSIEPLPKHNPTQTTAIKPKPTPTTAPKVKRIWHCDVCKTTGQTNKAFIAHEETNKHKQNIVINTSNDNGEPKTIKTHYCDKCNYITSRQSEFYRHLMTTKHKTYANDCEKITKNPKPCSCDCGKIYKYRQGLYLHKKVCYLNNKSIINTNETPSVMEMLSQNKELMKLLIVQNKEHREETSKLQNTILELVPKIGNNN